VSEPSIEQRTGELYSDLWGPYEAKLFEDSVALFEKRLRLAGLDPAVFRDKLCLDAGCGGGRNTIAMGRLGAKKVTGIDVGEKGLEDARRRAGAMANIEFRAGSILELPFPDATFDIVWCAGVIMHTPQPERGLDELARVTRPGGNLYLLVYASGGLRWPLIQLLRPIGQQLGKEVLEQAISAAGLPANKRRTFLDDLLVPCIDFFRWERLEHALRRRGFTEIARWGRAPRLDHEASLPAYRADLESLLALLAGGDRIGSEPHRGLFAAGHAMVDATVRTVQWFEKQVEIGGLTEDQALDRVVGQGHHRLWCTREH
jgi:SAM-dependent methyltransferase